MRVLAFCDYFDDHAIGGAERVAREIYALLSAEHGLHITVVGAVPKASKGTSAGSDQENFSVWTQSGVDLTPLVGAQLLVWRGLRRVAEHEVAAHRPDVIHLNGLHFHGSVIGARLARRHSIPSVATAHLGSLRALGGGGGVAARVFDRVVAGHVARSADRILAVSDSVSKHVRELGVDRNRIGVARNGVDRALFSPGPARPIRLVLHAVLVGRLIANKGTLDALEALARVRASGRDVRLTLVGDGPLETSARQRAGARDLHGAVDFTGRVDDVARWLQGADVSLRPSYTEGLPLAVLESLACGTPVICSNVPGNRELVQHRTNGLIVEPGDVTALAGALTVLYDDRSLLMRLGASALASSAAFSWEASARAHLDAFELVARKAELVG